VWRQPSGVVARAKGKNEDCKLGVARIGWCRNSVAESRFSGKSVWDLQRQHRRGEREQVVGWAGGRGNGRAIAAGNGRGIQRWLRDALPADQRWPLSSRRSVGLVGSACWNAGCLGADPAQGSIARHWLERVGWGRNCCGVPYPTSHGWRGLGARGRAFAAGASRRLGLNGGVSDGKVRARACPGEVWGEDQADKRLPVGDPR
jgi:hypothetical protein